MTTESRPPVAPQPTGRARGALPEAHLPALDGIRAVALVAVFAYHLGVPWADGGYLGVSQFFTLSGFLITSLLLGEMSVSGSVALRRFWMRRFRRLLPASLAALALVVAFGAVAADGSQLTDLPGQVLACVLYVVNWLFIREGTSYASLFAEPSPVQHFWSLAIEEQFYILLPLGIVAFARAARSAPPILLVWVAGLLALGSTGLMVVLERSGASFERLYFGTDTRAAEMLVGVALAALLAHRPISSTSSVARVILPVAGALALLASVALAVVLGLDDPFLTRGGLLLVAVLTATTIAAVVNGRGPVVSVLGWAPVAAVGRITYGLYLYHWPILLWLDEERTGLDGVPLGLIRVVVTTIVAVASYHFLEMPIREGRWRLPGGDRARVVLAPMVAVVVVLAMLGVASIRDVADPLATLSDQDSASPPLPASAARVLALVDDSSAPVGALLAEDAAADGELEAVDVLPFDCAVVVRNDCGGPERELATVAAELRPDVVLIMVNDWPAEQMAAASGLAVEDRVSLRGWFAGELSELVDVLAAEGAMVLWTPRGAPDVRTAVYESKQPFATVAEALAASHPGFGKSEAAAGGDEAGLDPVRTRADQLTAVALEYAGWARGLPRVMVVGDSSAKSMGWGLQRWAAADDVAVVWSVAVEGCGLVEGGVYRTTDGGEAAIAPQCAQVDDDWVDQIDRFRPDVVLVLTSNFDLAERRLPEWGDFRGPGDAEFDELLVDTYVDAVDVLSSSGATVRWVEAPCTGLGGFAGFAGDGSLIAPVSVDDIGHLNDELLGRVVAARAQVVETVDLFSVMCPDGEFVRDVGVRNTRPDGIHFSEEGSLWLARTHGRELLGMG